ncbi:hypothetical protein AMAG_12599 [Allomyces macrogynus ATCC 38327]|uniref:Cyclin-domain-containing protein n=1 Tax=Allomyces macrogynus (strain ATCC 38327) TaxID=578462 RepID=A0A0L0SZU9_ALLM3|nr:hypothetical protein AMAG_12599 [Allomyces macrogynus ATCC 38327]|eukprot:KNE67884.1 hypothetical protein AMAG_12599 [Allomyces macrogynus ATCC 38327]
MDLLTFPAADTARFMAALLDTIATANDTARASGTMPAPVSRFHARAPPPISIHAYLARILKYAPCENAVFIAVLVYLDRMARARVPFVVCTNNMHRLLITAIMVATKFHSDVFFTNVHYAKVGGVTVAELNMLELEFLFINEFNLTIQPADLQRYADRLLDHAIQTKLALPRLPATKSSTPAIAAAVLAAAPATTTTTTSTPSPSLAATTASAPPAPAPVPSSSSTPAAAPVAPRYPTPIPPTIGTPPARVRPQPAAPQRNPSSLYISTRAPPSPRSARALHMLAHRGLTAAVAAMHMDAPKRMPSLYSTAAAAVQAASSSAPARTGTSPVPSCASPAAASASASPVAAEPTHVIASPILAASSPAIATASPRLSVASPATPKTPLGPRATIRAGKSLRVLPLPRCAQLPPGYVPPGTRARGAGPHDAARPTATFRYPTAFPAAASAGIRKGTTTPSTTPPTSPCVTTAAAAAAVMANLRKGQGGGGAGSPAVPPASPMHVVRG